MNGCTASLGWRGREKARRSTQWSRSRVSKVHSDTHRVSRASLTELFFYMTRLKTIMSGFLIKKISIKREFFSNFTTNWMLFLISKVLGKQNTMPKKHLRLLRNKMNPSKPAESRDPTCQLYSVTNCCIKVSIQSFNCQTSHKRTWQVSHFKVSHLKDTASLLFCY